MLLPLSLAALSAVQMVVLLSDEEVAAGAHRRLRERDDGHSGMYLGGIHQAFYADTPRSELNIRACCGAAGSLNPENRLEMTFPSVRFGVVAAVPSSSPHRPMITYEMCWRSCKCWWWCRWWR